MFDLFLAKVEIPDEDDRGLLILEPSGDFDYLRGSNTDVFIDLTGLDVSSMEVGRDPEKRAGWRLD